VLQLFGKCVASVLQRVAVCCNELTKSILFSNILPANTTSVTVCRSVSQCVAVCRSVLQVCCKCVAVCYKCVAMCCVLQCVAVCCSVLQCVGGCCGAGCNVVSRSILLSNIFFANTTCVAVCRRVLQCVAVCCSVLQCFAVDCSVLQFVVQIDLV